MLPPPVSKRVHLCSKLISHLNPINPENTSLYEKVQNRKVATFRVWFKANYSGSPMVNHHPLQVSKMFLPFVKAGTPIRSITKTKTVVLAVLGWVVLLSCLPHAHANEGRPQVSKFSFFLTSISPFPCFVLMHCHASSKQMLLVIPSFCSSGGWLVGAW
jgi:hypothetical protein